MTAIRPTRAIAVRDGVIAGTACFSLLGTHEHVSLDGVRAARA